MPSRGEIWLAFDEAPIPVVVLSTDDEVEVRTIQVVPAAEMDISGVAIELPIGPDDGVPTGVLRVALPEAGRINCAWVLTLDEADLSERIGALSDAKLARLGEMMHLAGLE